MVGRTLRLIAAAEAGAFQYQAPQAPARTPWWAIWGQVFYFLLVFAMVIGLTYLVTRALANRNKNVRKSLHLRVLDELTLGIGRSILLLDCVDRILIVGSTDKSLTPLGQIDDPSMVAQLREADLTAEGPLTDFGSILKQALRPRETDYAVESQTLEDARRNAQGLRDLAQRFVKQGRSKP